MPKDRFKANKDRDARRLEQGTVAQDNRILTIWESKKEINRIQRNRIHRLLKEERVAPLAKEALKILLQRLEGAAFPGHEERYVIQGRWVGRLKSLERALHIPQIKVVGEWVTQEIVDSLKAWTPEARKKAREKYLPDWMNDRKLLPLKPPRKVERKEL